MGDGGGGGGSTGGRDGTARRRRSGGGGAGRGGDDGGAARRRGRHHGGAGADACRCLGPGPNSCLAHWVSGPRRLRVNVWKGASTSRIVGWCRAVSEGPSSVLSGEMPASDWWRSRSQPILTPDPVNVDAPDYFTTIRISRYNRVEAVSPEFGNSCK